jgi:energy-coupling factor transporter ATP-binding protein EcfA2
MIPYLTAVENVMLAQYFHSMTDEQEALEALERVGLRERAHHLPAQLSGGEQQRVCIARALINDPKIILADEPTGNLDAANEEIVLRLLRELHDQGRTIVMVTHDPVMARLADRRIEMHHGRIASQEIFSINDEEQFEEVLEEIWVLTEEQGEPAEVGRMQTNGALPISVAVERLEKLGLVTLRAHNGSQHEHKGVEDNCHAPLHSTCARPEHGPTIVEFTPRGHQRAADIVRRHRLAELLFTQSFGMTDTAQVSTEACKFDHILSPEMTEKICEFLHHPTTCPHGAPIPPGKCCETAPRNAKREATASV